MKHPIYGISVVVSLSIMQSEFAHTTIPSLSAFGAIE